MATLVLTEDQVAIIGYALMMARREQRQKIEATIAGYAEPYGDGIKQRIAGFQERITRLEDAYDALPAESDVHP